MDEYIKTDEKSTSEDTEPAMNTEEAGVNGTTTEAGDNTESGETAGDSSDDGNADATDYDKIIKDDLIAIREQFPEAAGLTSITELDNPLRYAALRDMGLSPKEAYLATQRRTDAYDNRKHLRGSVPTSAGAARDAMSQAELSAARDLFSGLSDRELQRLYKKVTK